MATVDEPQNVSCLEVSAVPQKPTAAPFPGKAVTVGPWGLVLGVGVGSEWPEVSFKGMFNFHSLFLKSNFLQRHED